MNFIEERIKRGFPISLSLTQYRFYREILFQTGIQYKYFIVDSHLRPLLLIVALFLALQVSDIVILLDLFGRVTQRS